MTFTRVPDFDDTSARKGRCYILNIPKPAEDQGVFRGPSIDFEGHLDISERAIREAAHEIGMIDADKAAALAADLTEAREALGRALDERDDYRRRLQGMILENAELVTQVQRWQAWADQDEVPVDEAGNVVVSLDELVESELS